MKINQKSLNIIKIPSTINIFYCPIKNILIIKGHLAQKSLKLETKIHFKKTEIKITSIPLSKISNNIKKKLKERQRSAIAKIKQVLTDTYTTTYKRLNFKGVGYRASYIGNNWLLMKLGYSHLVYYKTPAHLKIFCLKFTKIFLSGLCYKDVTCAASWIRSKKVPEPYKGKGILYANEKIKLKTVKKT